jgi:hypothetical protein
MSRKKIVILIIVVLVVPVAVLAGMFALLQSPRAVNMLAAAIQPLTGISLHVDDISISHHLDARISGFRIKTVKENGFDILLAQADLNASVGPGWQVEVDKILLTGPKFTFHLKNEKSEIDPFEVLKKLPPVHLLMVKNGQLELKSDSSVYSIPGLEMTIRDFQPEGGGKLHAKSRFSIRSEEMTGRGMMEITLNVSRFSPRPSGSGSSRLSLETGSFSGMKLEDLTLTAGFKLNGEVLSLDGAKATIRNLSRGEGSEKINLRDIKTQFNSSYDQKTSAFTLTAFEGSGADVGLLKGRASGTVTPLTWVMSLRASSLELARVFGLVKPLLPETYRNWTFKGKGALELESEGRQADGTTVWKAAAVVDLSEGGFASADSSKAGERITGRIEFRLGSPGKGRQGSFQVTMEGGDGELLWDQYYQDFKGERVRLVSKGSFAQNPFFLSSSGTLDLFRTGDYAFSADMSPDRSVFSLQAKGISCPRLYGVLMQNFINQNYPNLQDMTLEGESDLKLTVSISQHQKMIEGHLALRGGAVRSPSNKLMLTGLTVSLPYDLTLAGNPSPAPASGARQGSMAFDRFEQGDDIRIGKMETPAVLSGNRFILPDPIDFSLFGGEIRLAGFRVENLLLDEIRVETGLTIKHLNLGELVGQAAPLPLPGMIDGDFSSVVFQEEKWSTTGGLVAQIWGGRVTIENLFAERPFSSSRIFGADAAFDQIDLEAVTASIEVGRMTGLIKGSLKNFTMEYGQPARFDLVIISDKSRKVPQQISVDAINDLSIISTGSGAVSAVLSSGLNRFFKEYPYSEIGIRCTLADDVFFLRGLIHDAGKEYLVRKAWLRGIDIVNQNPDNSISFKDMAERVGRIFEPRPESKKSVS